MAHAELAELLAEAVRPDSFPRFGERYRIAAMLLDLATSLVGSTERTIKLVAQWEAAPDDPALALEICKRVNGDPVVKAVLQAMHV